MLQVLKMFKIINERGEWIGFTTGYDSYIWVLQALSMWLAYMYEMSDGYTIVVVLTMLRIKPLCS